MTQTLQTRKKILRSYNPWLGSLKDISQAQIYCAKLTSVVFFLLSFIVTYSLNKIYIFSILVSSYPIFFCLFLFRSSTFALSIFLLCLSLYILYFLFFFLSLTACLLLSFLPVFLSPLTFFVSALLSLSPAVSFFVCLLRAFLKPSTNRPPTTDHLLTDQRTTNHPTTDQLHQSLTNQPPTNKKFEDQKNNSFIAAHKGGRNCWVRA